MPSPILSSELSRRALLGAGGLAALGAIATSWPRLTASDIPGRHDDALTIAIIGTSQDAAARQNIVDAFMRQHPDIPVRIQAIQGADWGDFFAKILTMVAAGQSPDVVTVATEGAQLFADRLALPLDRYIQRDAEQMRQYFDDVHPSLIEAFMYKGSQYVLPTDFNCANMYYNTDVMAAAGLERPADDWTREDFVAMLRAMKTHSSATSTPYFWTNRLFGGVVPWLYVNDTSILVESHAPGGEWLWDTFYPDQAGTRTGGPLWTASNALDDRVGETFEFLRQLVVDGLGVRPEEGGGNTLVGLFASGQVGATPAGGYWAYGLHEAKMRSDQFDVQFFPRWRTQRHQFGAAGYAVMRDTDRADQAWEWIKFVTSEEGMALAYPNPNTTPTRRSMVNAAFYSETGPQHWQVFYDTLDRFPTSGPIPAPPAQAAVEMALAKNVAAAVSGSAASVTTAMSQLHTDLSVALEGSTR